MGSELVSFQNNLCFCHYNVTFTETQQYAGLLVGRTPYKMVLFGVRQGKISNLRPHERSGTEVRTGRDVREENCRLKPRGQVHLPRITVSSYCF